MKRLGISVFFGIMLAATMTVSACAQTLLIPVGKIVGLQLRATSVSVAAYDDLLGKNAKDAGLKIGDILIDINDTPIMGAEDVPAALELNRNATAITVRRGNRTLCLKMKPVITQQGQKLGVYLRQGIAGIGTVTWYDPASGVFGALGHGVNDSAGCLMEMRDGTAFTGSVVSVTRGRSGHPGQLKGCADSDDPCALLLRNTPQGVFGSASRGWSGEPLPIAQYEELHTGPALIRSTVCGDTPRDYSVEILKLYPAGRSDGRNLLLKVTDPDLLSATGGIVQGMSGSPILQDGRLVGAVTHVLVNDPTMGYGIFIGNMLEAAA